MTSSACTAALAVRAVFALFGVAALALFGALFAISQLGDDVSGMSLVHGAFSAGALPAAVAAYFWLYRRERRAFAFGIGAVLLAVAVHYVAFAVLAHSSASAGLSAAAIELAICVGVVIAAHRHLQRTAEPS